MDERKEHLTIENKKEIEKKLGKEEGGGGERELSKEEWSSREMLGRIWESSQGIEIPDALKPGQIKKHITDRHSQKRKIFRATAVAACLCLCFGGGMLALKNTDAPTESRQSVNESYESGGGQSELQNGNSKADGMDSSRTDDGADTDAYIQEDADEAAEAPLKKIGKMYTLASGYGDVYDVIEKASRQVRYRDMHQKEASAKDGIKDISAVIENARMEDSDVQFEQEDSISADSSFSKEENDFSITNLQVEGVDESDIVKTDGRYIYVVKNDRIQVIDVQNKVPEIEGKIVPDLNEDTDRICEMYVADHVLTLIIQTERMLMQQEDNKDKARALENTSVPDAAGDQEGSDAGNSRKEEPVDGMLSDMAEEEDMAVCTDVVSLDVSIVTKVLTYDIADPKNAVLMHETEQDGWYQTSRKIGSCLYLFTNKSLYVADNMLREDAEKKDAASGWLPCVNGQAVKADCIYLPKEGNDGFLMSSIDIADNSKVLDTKLIVNNSPQVYVTSRSVYLYETDYTNEIQKTRIARFELDHGMIRAKAAATVKGCIEDTFAIHETENYLQVLTSVTGVEPWENRVYVLDMDLEKIGKLTGLAEGERIYSARFFGTIGYFVTYRNTDPLFTVDFSDPSAPKIIGELKVTGFSEYLHFWDKDHLLGIGYETDPESGRNIGVKLSMFDISDPTKVTEEAKTVLKDVDACEAMYDYKCILVSLQKNVIAFTTQEYGEGCKEDYRVYSYEDGKFVSRLVHSLSRKNVFDGSHWRSVYAGDVLYLVNEKKTTAFDMTDQWKEIGKVKY